jgi:hypothetical protein
MVPSVVNIDPNGDLILHVNHQDYINQSYRVSITVLRSTSKYFDSLLDPAKFREGRAVQERCNELSQRYSNTAAIPPAELPRVTILDLGQIPLESVSATVLQHFLRVLHNATTASSIPRTHFLAILVLIADRFDAVQAVAKYIKAHGWMRDPTDHDHQFKEVLVRQRILIGHIVRSSTWLGFYSACLIREGSRCWTPSSVDMADEAAWWHLPHGIEGQPETMGCWSLIDSLQKSCCIDAVAFSTRSAPCKAISSTFTFRSSGNASWATTHLPSVTYFNWARWCASSSAKEPWVFRIPSGPPQTLSPSQVTSMG